MRAFSKNGLILAALVTSILIVWLMVIKVEQRPPPLLISASLARALAGAPAQRPILTVTNIPVDGGGRAKFPGEDPLFIDGLGYLNRIVNQMIRPVSDDEHYGVGDKMVSEPDDLQGDCEDYALSKMTILGRAGVPIIWMARLRLVMVHLPGGDAYGHAILEVRLPNGGITFLDNRFPDLMTRAELGARGYAFYDW